MKKSPHPELYDRPGLSVTRYDLETPGPFKGDIPFYVAEGRKAKGPILELASGTGRVSLPLARAGCDVTGLELSPAMLKVAKSKMTEDLAPRLRFVRGDMRRFRLNRRFALILIPFRAFHHLLTIADQKACLKAIHRHLLPGGRLIINLFDPRLDWCLPGPCDAGLLRRSLRDPETGGKIEVRISGRRNDPLDQIGRFETWTFSLKDRKGRLLRKESRVLTLRWTYRYEMQHLLELCGFKPLACYGDFAKGSPAYAAEQIWVARKASRPR